MNHPADTPAAGAPAALPRRLAAIVYDTLLLFGVLFAAAVPVVALTAWHLGAESFADGSPLAGRPWFGLYLLAVSYAFYGWFWTHGGQTLGMRAWKLRVITAAGTPLGWGDALLRFSAALLSWLPAGLGFFWQLLDRDRLTWHDRLSGTRLIRLPKHPAAP